MLHTRYRILLVLLITAVLLSFSLVVAMDNAAMDWYNKGYELNSVGKFQEAAEAFQKALDIDPNYALSWYGRGVALNNLGRFEDADRAFTQVWLLDPNNAPCWYGKGLALNNLGRYEEANNAFDQALLRNRRFEEAWFGKAVALENLNRNDESLRAYNEALSMDPGSASLIESRDRLETRIASAPTPTITPVRTFRWGSQAPNSTPTKGKPLPTIPGTNANQSKILIKTPNYKPGTINSQLGASGPDAGATSDLSLSDDITNAIGEDSNPDLSSSLSALSDANIISAGNKTATANFVAAVGGASDEAISLEQSEGSDSNFITSLTRFINKMSASFSL
ncbi:MAG: tetratricopeptide repeat protein [Methanoregula sp.]